MSATITDTISVRAEKAIAAHIRGHRDANADTSTYTGDVNYDCTRGGSLSGVGIYEGRITQKRSSPSVIVMCSSTDKPWDVVEWYRATVEIKLFTHRHESASSVELAEVVHNTRSKAIYDLILNEETLKEALNRVPAPAADSRAVTEFTVMGSDLAGNSGDVSDEMLTESWTLELFCAPYDAAG